jgi:hypothetical protein
MADRSLMQWMQIIGEILAIYETDYKAAQADGRVTILEGIVLAGKVFDVLLKYQVTVEELREFLKTADPLLSLLHLR